jgi:WD40 repeat protein
MTSVSASAPQNRRRRFALYALIALALSAVLAAAFLGFQSGKQAQAVRVASYSLSRTEPPIPPKVEIRALDFSREGSLLAIGLSNDTTLLWRVTGENPQTVGSLKTELKPRDRIDGMSVRLATAAPLVAIGVNALDLDDPKRGNRGFIRLWNFETQKSRDVWESKEGFGELAISPDGERVAVWAAPLRPLELIDCPTGKVRWSDPKVEGRFSAITFSPDGRHVAAGVDREVRIYECETGRMLRRCTARMGTQLSIAFSSDGSRLLTGGANPHLHVWSVRDSKEDQEIPIEFPPRRSEEIQAVAFARDSQAVLAFIAKFEQPGTGLVGSSLAIDRY